MTVITKADDVIYEPTWDSLDTRPLPAWYDEAKSGSGQTGKVKLPEYVDFMSKYYSPKFTYQEFAKDFRAEFFNATEWAEIFENSGAKYIVLYNWNSVDVGPHRDIVGELSKAVRDRGLTFGAYHSLYEWFNPLYRRDKATDFTDQEYVFNKVLPEMRELVETYNISVLWSDGDWEAPDTYWNSTEFLAWLYNDSPVKDEIVVNDRWGKDIPCHHGGVYTCNDRYNPGSLQPHKWENAMTIDKKSWGFRRNANLADYMTISELISQLASTVSCGGNLLMNIGPTSYGTISPIYEERLSQMGQWLGINGEAIYGSQPWTAQNDSLTEGIWYTSKGNNVYAILLKWNKDAVLGSAVGLFQNDRPTVTLLGNEDTGRLDWYVDNGASAVYITLPADKNSVKSEWAWVLKIETGSTKQNLLFSFLLVAIFASFVSNSIADYEANWDSLDSRPLPSWYDEAKFGIFIHWGIFSVPSFGNEWFWSEWKGNDPTFVNFMQENYPPDFTYQEFAKDFRAEFFNASEWAEIFANSGAKYVVLTAKHHEGYTLWPSTYSYSWNSMDIGPHRDIVGELAAAVRAKGLAFGVYHSLYEWFNPLYEADKQSNYVEKNFVYNKVLPELKELVENYNVSILWSDGEWEANSDYWNSTSFLAWLYNESPVKDEVVVNDRWGNDATCSHGGFITCSDRYNPGTLQEDKWENAMTMDKASWAFRRNARLSEYYGITDLILNLVSTVSCGGNILMNVGPTSYGTIAPIYEERFTQLGTWLSINGEAIYGTQPWTFQNDTTSWGVWYTSKDTTVYAIVVHWTWYENILSLGSPVDYFTDNNPTVTMLGNEEDGNLEWKIDDGNLLVYFPDRASVKSEWAWTLKIQPENK
ncbi:hypothetical protein NQ317_004850 [Molorchus minor]|uniref:alpha-L-fucosidase n=1 Tax=Molorchus minor TaxID=1323400 RepID=A0ABQ9J870_9CUCU|nr:hypothetical protein NQ317_004850 [Molorchus minor]